MRLFKFLLPIAICILHIALRVFHQVPEPRRTLSESKPTTWSHRFVVQVDLSFKSSQIQSYNIVSTFYRQIVENP